MDLALFNRWNVALDGMGLLGLPVCGTNGALSEFADLK